MRFCGACGTLAPPEKSAKSKCWACGKELGSDPEETEDAAGRKELARRHGVESRLPSGEKVAELEQGEVGTRSRATVDELCPNCGARGLDWHAVQLRSADEGQTVFYECRSCGHTFAEDN